MKLLTVVIPVYNTARYLPRCLRSVLVPEALDRLELILINDGSTDSSGSILLKAARRYPGTVRVIDKENGGHGSAVNAGLRAATGRFFRVLDSDDWFDTPAFLRYLDALSSCDEDLIVTPYTQEYSWTKPRVCVRYAALSGKRSYALDELDLAGPVPYVSLAAATWKTELLRRCGLQLSEHCSYVDMQYILFPIPLVQRVRLINESVYRYFIGRTGQSMDPAQFLKNIPQHEQVLRSLIDFYAAQRPTLNAAARDYIERVISLMTYTHLELLCRRMPGRLAAFRRCRDFDAFLRQTAPEIYRRTDTNTEPRIYRRLGYLPLLLGRWVLPRLLHFRRTLHGSSL